jgi:hypothetical protein
MDMPVDAGQQAEGVMTVLEHLRVEFDKALEQVLAIDPYQTGTLLPVSLDRVASNACISSKG